jgi:hypothetical protein
VGFAASEKFWGVRRDEASKKYAPRKRSRHRYATLTTIPITLLAKVKVFLMRLERERCLIYANLSIEQGALLHTPMIGIRVSPPYG